MPPESGRFGHDCKPRLAAAANPAFHVFTPNAVSARSWSNGARFPARVALVRSRVPLLPRGR
eukprot:3084276-Lingulodinium_polyedra.AAC.1